MEKPLGKKAYGSIGHLPGSRVGSGDHTVPDGQAKICLEKTRDKHDLVIVQEKLDGSCVAVALIDDVLHSLTRAGWPARSSPHRQHHMFADYVDLNESHFRKVLINGERVVGEWLAQAHGTIYDLDNYEPFFPFDIMDGNTRLPYLPFYQRIEGIFQPPHLITVRRGPTSIEEALELHEYFKVPCDQIEGVVYRVERHGKVDFLAKYVRPGKIDGKYFDTEVWNV